MLFGQRCFIFQVFQTVFFCWTKQHIFQTKQHNLGLNSTFFRLNSTFWTKQRILFFFSNKELFFGQNSCFFGQKSSFPDKNSFFGICFAGFQEGQPDANPGPGGAGWGRAGRRKTGRAGQTLGTLATLPRPYQPKGLVLSGWSGGKPNFGQNSSFCGLFVLFLGLKVLDKTIRTNQLAFGQNTKLENQ